MSYRRDHAKRITPKFKRQELWEQYDYTELLRAAVEIGYGTGEELRRLLIDEQGFTDHEADTLIDLLRRIS